MAAADIGSPCAQNGSIRTLRPAGTKLQHRPPLCRPGDSVGLGGNQALMVDAEQKIGFDELRLDSGGTHRQNRLSGEHRRALRHCPDVAGEAEIGKIIQELLTEHIAAAQVGNILLRKMQILDILDNLLQTCRDGEAAAVGTAAEKQVKIGNPVAVAGGKIALTHGQLIEIAEHGQIQFVVDHHRYITSFV